MDKDKWTINSLVVLHGIYFFLTGIWPLLHIESFMAVTGPKNDVWLVKTVGVLLLVMGTGLFVAGRRKEVSLPVIIIAVGGAIGFILIDLVYVIRNVIEPVYLIDAGFEFLLLVCWGVVLTRKRRNTLLKDHRFPENRRT